MVSSEKGEKWSNPSVELVSLSYLDGVELLQEGSKQLMLRWKKVVFWSVHLYLNGILTN